MIMGLLTTGWSIVRGSKLLQYGLMAAALVAVFLLYSAGQRRAGAAEAVAKAAQRAVKRMERSREIHNEIARLPLTDRARRLRDLDARR
jgi:hypothetical protein